MKMFTTKLSFSALLTFSLLFLFIFSVWLRILIGSDDFYAKDTSRIWPVVLHNRVFVDRLNNTKLLRSSGKCSKEERAPGIKVSYFTVDRHCHQEYGGDLQKNRGTSVGVSPRPYAGTILLPVLLYKPKLFWVSHYTFPVSYVCNTENVTIHFYEGHHISKEDEIIVFSNETYDYDWDELQRTRKNNQIWIMSSVESQSTNRKLIPPFKYHDRAYNLSMTFHSEADIVVPYGNCIPNEKGHIKGEGKGGTADNKKTELIAWISSRCGVLGWNRTRFVYDLSKHLTIHKYGKCGNLSLPRGGQEFNVLRRYKFILALENNCCGEYITEKFWNAIAKYEAVPVVMGARKSDYERLSPPNSFIHIDDFESMWDLANYLLELDKDSVRYKQFVRWKDKWTVNFGSPMQQLPVSQESACHFASKFIQKRQTNLQRNEHMTSSLDLYGPSWLGSCLQCGNHSWIQNYSNSRYLVKNVYASFGKED